METTEAAAPLRSSDDVSFSRVALFGATSILVVFGATAAIYGPLLVPFSHHFHISLPAAGAVLSVHFLGALCGVPLTWRAQRRYRGNFVLAGTLVTMAIGALGAALAHSFDELLGSVAVIGLGFGGTDFSCNALLLRSQVSGRARRLSVANGGYSVGAVVGPLLVIAARPAHYALIFLSLGLAALALMATIRGIRAPRITPMPPHFHHSSRRKLVAVFVAAYVLYVATETTAAGWIAPQLHRAGDSESIGAITTAGFWLGLAIGRFLAGPIHKRVSDRRLVVVGLALTAALSLGASITTIAPVMYPLAGLSLALVYPMGLMWFARLSPGDNNGLALIIFTMMAGGVVGPALTGLAVSLLGVHAVPGCVSIFAAADLAVFIGARQMSVSREEAA